MYTIWMADRHFDLSIIMFSSKILKQADFQIFKNGSTQVLSSTCSSDDMSPLVTNQLTTSKDIWAPPISKHNEDNDRHNNCTLICLSESFIHVPHVSSGDLLWGLPSAIVVLAPDQKGISSFQFPHPDIPLETTQRQLLVSILLHFIQGLWSASLSVITAESNKKVVAYQ